MLATLDPHRIDLWFTFCTAVSNPALLETYRGLLTEQERAQEKRFYFDRDRHRYLITRALVRTTLSRYVGVRPQDWSFAPNSYGRPEVRNDNPTVPRLSFNLSHTSQLVVLAVTSDHPIGVDTEDGYSREAPLAVADRFFAPREVADLRALAPERQAERFFQYWTLKESYIKARGMGLSIPLGEFAFHFGGGQNERIGFETEASLDDDASQWTYWQFGVREGHLVALCARRLGSGRQQVQAREVVPLGIDLPMDLRPVAQSPL
ncbi:MAG TPA: 4'-phosphopantetheinyl transferase superfamily protein [Steroidobacteraceae bacterium]|jgi:4'-phosphopantetheinyl transferase